MILFRWRCRSCQAPWASSMPGETRCPFCGSQDITETPAQAVEFGAHTAGRRRANDPALGTEPVGGPDAA